MPKQEPFVIQLSDRQFDEYQRSKLRKIEESVAALSQEINDLIRDNHQRAGNSLPLVERLTI